MDYLVSQVGALLAMPVIAIAGFIVRDVVLARIQRRVKQLDTYASITADPHVRVGAAFRSIRTTSGDEFCGTGVVRSIEPGRITLQLTGHADKATVGLACTLTGEEFRGLVPLWEQSILQPRQ